MGREYIGDISGKFGFAIQCSCDIQNLIEGILYEIEYEWHGCGCNIELECLENNTFCDECYETYDAHLEDVCTIIDVNEKLYFESSNINFYIHRNKHFEKLNQSLLELKEKIPQDVILEFNKIENNEEIIDGYNDIFKDVYDKINTYEKNQNKYENKYNTSFDKLIEYFLRYKLGIQIKYILNKQETCFVCCET